jgi:hypothetical protein
VVSAFSVWVGVVGCGAVVCWVALKLRFVLVVVVGAGGGVRRA